MRQRDRILMWSQRDLETSIESICTDITDHIEFLEQSKTIKLDDLRKQATHIRYEMMTLAKKIETKITQERNRNGRDGK